MLNVVGLDIHTKKRHKTKAKHQTVVGIGNNLTSHLTLHISVSH